jgi:hypothetical protein
MIYHPILILFDAGFTPWDQWGVIIRAGEKWD